MIGLGTTFHVKVRTKSSVYVIRMGGFIAKVPTTWISASLQIITSIPTAARLAM